MTSTYITKDQNKKEIVCCSLSPLLSLCNPRVWTCPFDRVVIVKHKENPRFEHVT